VTRAVPPRVTAVRHHDEGRGDLFSGRQLPLLAIVLAVLPLVASAVALVVDIGADYHPAADQALIELRTRDVGFHPVLVGLVSLADWSHPGPALFYVLAVPYWLTGGSSIGLALGALVINGLAIVGMALVARRRGGTPLLLCTLVGCSLLVRALGPDFMRDPWIPYITVLPFGLLIFLSWSMTCGETWALPVAAAVASFLTQTHIGYVPMAIPLLAWGAVWLVVLARRGRHSDTRGRLPRPTDVARAGALATAILLVMWLPPVVDELVNEPGNIVKIEKYFREAEAGVHSPRQGYRVVAEQFGPSPEWLTGAPEFPLGVDGDPDFVEPESLHSEPIPVLLLPFGLAGLVLWRRRSSDGCRLVATISLAFAAGILAVARTIGPVFVYRLRWTWVLAMVSLVVVAWTVWTAGAIRRAKVRWLAPVFTSALVVLTAVNTVTAARAGIPEKATSSVLARLLPSVVAALPERDGDVVVRSTTFGSGPYAAGLMLYLERRGIAARSDEVGRVGFGDHRVHEEGPVRAVLTVSTNHTVDSLSARPDLRLVAYWGTLSRWERAQIAARVVALDEAHEDSTVSDVSWYVKRLKLTKQLGSAVAVFAQRST
jgi:hypothetical protein